MMAIPHPVHRQRTYLVECFGSVDPPNVARRGFLATLAIADDEQVLVLVRGTDEAAATHRCVAAGLTVDRVVEVALRPAWRWNAVPQAARHRARRCPR